MGMLMRRRIKETQEKIKKAEEEKKVLEREKKVAFIPDTAEQSQETAEKYTYDELNSMTVKQIKELADSMGFTMSKIIKDEVIQEFLSQQM